ncbi:MAG: adenylosuccinate lyase [Candidatus Deianiraeaceae bacterium]|jgi:adenylosuccinate lyase
MSDIWTEDNKYNIWLKIELLVAEAMVEDGIVPMEKVMEIREKATWSVERIAEIEAVTKHDVIAFLTNISESVGGDATKYLHLGMTSSDLLDTTLSYQLKQSGDILINGLNNLLEALKSKALKYKNSVCIGRSHGIHAEPVTFGLKFIGFYAEFERNLKRLELALEDVSVCAISGAVGTYANIAPKIQAFVAKNLDLKEETVSTQVIPRDRHANFFNCLALIASSIERIATEIRHLQRTEVLEVEEAFTKGQKGSSAMPHKRNPVLSENLTGLARMVRSYCMPAMENVALWHERDISHSSVERFIAPDSCITLDFAINRLVGLVENLIIYEENAIANMNKLKGLIFSQRVMLTLIEKAGVTREDAYKIVQENAMKIWQGETDKDFKTLLQENPDIVSKLDKSQIEDIFDISYHTKNIDHIFQKVFG